MAKTERAKLIEEYALAEKAAKTKKEKDALKKALNEKLVAMGEDPLLTLTEEQRKAKKDNEDAEGFTVVDPSTIPDVPEHFPTYDPDHKGQTVRCKDKRGVWDVHYNERGYQDGVARVTFN